MNSDIHPMNSNLEAFIREARAIADQREIAWSVPLATDGIAPKGQGWNLTQMANASPPPTEWLNDFGTDAKTVEILNSSPPSGPKRSYRKRPLSHSWQDSIKAIAIDQLFVRQNTCGHVACNVARPLRVLATCAWTKELWELTVDDVNFAIETARKVQASGKLADLIFGVVRSILDPNHLVDNGPLFPALERGKHVYARASKFFRSQDEIRASLEERKNAQKLPERRAFWELVRIVFTETPKSFLDLLRFAQVKTLILTGLRDGECVLLPADWKRYREYFDYKNRPASEAGGVSRSLMLRHFAEKQRIVYKDSVALFEAAQHVPEAFEEILTTTLDQVVVATEPLRSTLRRQIETGRLLPQFEPNQLVLAGELYTLLTGNPFILRWPKEVRQEYVKTYRQNYDPAIFDELRARQLDGVRNGNLLEIAVYGYFQRLAGIVPLRNAKGIVADSALGEQTVWSDVYIRIDELETALTTQVATKQSDTVPLRLSNGGKLAPSELLFLMPKRALSDGRSGGLCDIARYCAVGRMDSSMIAHALSSSARQTLFSSYGYTDDDRSLMLRPHSLRHLQNTELFRLGIADTIITKRFNRRKVAQSYEYDHRSLAEELDQIELTPELETRLGDKSATIARLIKSGKARGPIVDAFNRIQLTEGEDAAFEYLNAEADGFHSTPYGHCVNSFMVDPCPKHLECFTGCKHLSATDLAQNRHNLVQLEARFEGAIRAIEAKKADIIGRKVQPQLPSSDSKEEGPSDALQVAAGPIEKRRGYSVGLDNQLAHAKVRLEGVRKLLATPSGQLVFPGGSDLSQSPIGQEDTVLDGWK
jgi:hypothetical protein